MGNALKRKCRGLPPPFDFFKDVPEFPRRTKTLAKMKLNRIPEGLRARLAAFRPGGPITSRFLASNPAVLVVGENIFVHGGLHSDYHTDLEKINRETREWLLGKDMWDPPESLGPHGIPESQFAVLWSRKYSNNNEAKCRCDLLERALKTVPGAKRIVMGHTVQKSGINSVCNGTAIRIDVGMSKGLRNASAEALEIRDGQLTVISAEGRSPPKDGGDLPPPPGTEMQEGRTEMQEVETLAESETVSGESTELAPNEKVTTFLAEKRIRLRKKQPAPNDTRGTESESNMDVDEVATKPASESPAKHKRARRGFIIPEDDNEDEVMKDKIVPETEGIPRNDAVVVKEAETSSTEKFTAFLADKFTRLRKKQPAPTDFQGSESQKSMDLEVAAVPPASESPTKYKRARRGFVITDDDDEDDVLLRSRGNQSEAAEDVDLTKTLSAGKRLKRKSVTGESAKETIITQDNIWEGGTEIISEGSRSPPPLIRLRVKPPTRGEPDAHETQKSTQMSKLNSTASSATKEHEESPQVRHSVSATSAQESAERGPRSSSKERDEASFSAQNKPPKFPLKRASRISSSDD